MPARNFRASLSVIDLGWTAPDGTRVFSGLNITFGRECTGVIGRNGVGKSTLLKCLTRDLAPTSGRIVHDSSIAALRQTVQVDPEESIADLMQVSKALQLLRKAEAGDACPEDIADADWTLEARIEQVLEQVGLSASPDTPLVALSGGQRTRAALAGAMLRDPDFLILDEPTNDLDADGRKAVRDLLAGWKSGAVVVSHDRELLEIMDAIVEITPLGARRYGGNWSRYRELKDIEIAAVASEVALAERAVKQVESKAQQARERQQRRDAAGHRKAMRGDMPRILVGARRDRAERTGGDNDRLAERLGADAERDLEVATAKVERYEDVRIQVASSNISGSQRILDAAGVTFAYPGKPPVVEDFSLSITGPERIAITGGNGAGKTTVLDILCGVRSPQAGRSKVYVPFAYFDQRIGLLEAGASIIDNFRRINPGLDVQSCHGALARFGFRADAAERIASTLSGGQVLRAALACVIGSPRPPALLVLDEPTNHLDLDTIAAVEAGLRAFDGALIVVSHDPGFLEAVGINRRVQLRVK